MKQIGEIPSAISSAILRMCVTLAAEPRAEWARAMVAESQAIDGSAGQLAWSFGCLFAIIRAHISTLPKRAAERPLIVNAACLYWAGFSAYLIGKIAFQIFTFRIHESWTDAIMPVVLMLALSAFPAVVALGLWLLDDSARVLCMVFCFVHGMSCAAWMSTPGVHAAVPAGRVAVDIVIIVGMNAGTVRRAFRQRRTELRLGL